MSEDSDKPGLKHPPRIIGQLPVEVRPSHAASPRIEHAFSHRMRAIAHYAALGCRPGSIADSLGISPGRVSAVVATPACKAMVKEIQDKLFALDHTVVFKQMAPRAARTLYRVMNDAEEKGSTRVSAAAEILDRAYGKPNQKVEHEGSMVMELFKRLDEEKKTYTAEGGKIEEAEIVDEVKDWVSRNI